MNDKCINFNREELKKSCPLWGLFLCGYGVFVTVKSCFGVVWLWCGVLLLWLVVRLFCGFLWWVVKFVFVRGVGGWCVVLHCFEVLMHVFVVLWFFVVVVFVVFVWFCGWGF